MQPEPPKEESPDYDPVKALAEVVSKDQFDPRLKPLNEDLRTKQ